MLDQFAAAEPAVVIEPVDPQVNVQIDEVVLLQLKSTFDREMTGLFAAGAQCHAAGAGADALLPGFVQQHAITVSRGEFARFIVQRGGAFLAGVDRPCALCPVVGGGAGGG
ncbi:hypothetical protein D3C84_1109300 [compost metagenome]